MDDKEMFKYFIFSSTLSIMYFYEVNKLLKALLFEYFFHFSDFNALQVNQIY